MDGFLWMGVGNIFVGRMKHGDFCASFLEANDMDVVGGTELEDLVEIYGVVEF